MRNLTAFRDGIVLVAGSEVDVWAALHRRGDADGVLILDDSNGRAVDLDLRAGHGPAGPIDDTRKGRGRPKLGVVAREVTLLPRHWDWLARQRGGASAALRRLIDAARRAEGEASGNVDAAYYAMSALAGDRAGFEEAARALFANDSAGFDRQSGGWPQAIIDYVRRLAGW